MPRLCIQPTCIALFAHLKMKTHKTEEKKMGPMRNTSASKLFFLPLAPGLSSERERGISQFTTDLTTNHAKTGSIHRKLRRKSVDQIRGSPGPTRLVHLPTTSRYRQKQKGINMLLP